MERFRFLLSLGFVASFGLAAVIACDPPVAKKGPLKTTPDRPADDDNDDDDGDDDVAVTPVKPEADPPLPDGGQPPGRIYAHTATALYFFEPVSRSLTKIADFGGLGKYKFGTVETDDQVIDLAVDRDSVVYGTTFGGFVKIDPIDGKVTYIRKNSGTTIEYPNALAFVPMGSVDPTKEALVGYGPADGNAMQYLRIDTTTGEIKDIGDLNPPGAAVQYVSAGDIISMERNGKAYVAVRRAVVPDGGVEENDQLAEINPTTGTIKAIVGDLGAKLTYGLAQWAGTAYAFNEKGDIIELELAATGTKGKVIKSLAIVDGGTGWYGAGVTTAAPSKATPN